MTFRVAQLATTFVTTAEVLTLRRRIARRRRFDTPGRPLGTVPLFRYCPAFPAA